MEVIHRRCAGLDVHKKSVAVCVRVLGSDGRLQKQVRTFGTMTRDLLELGEWLTGQGVTHVAMESTGVFWKPLYNLLEGKFEILLCNAQHIKQVPGRKTDVKDCEWLAQLLQHGLLRGSFVPPRPLRDLRDLTRHRAQVIAEKTAVANRIHKVLEDANVKLGSVASDVLGASGRAVLHAMIEGENDPTTLAELAQRKLRAKIPQLKASLEGRVTEHHRFMLRTLFTHLTFLEKSIHEITNRIEEVMIKADAEATEVRTVPFVEAVRLLITMPGIEVRTAQNVVAEIGCNMAQFPRAQNLASWGGMCPGNNESAGRRKGGKTTKGNRWLRSALVQAAWAASHTKGTYLAAQFRRLAARRTKKPALVAVGHTMLVIAYHMLKTHTPYADLGPDHFDQLNPERLTRHLVKRLEKLGHKVTLEHAAA